MCVCVCLPWVGGDGRLWHSCPDCAVHRPGSTSEMSASKGCGGGGSCCSCWVWKPWYWERERGQTQSSLFKISKITVLFVHLVSNSLAKCKGKACCHTCVEIWTVHGSNHGTQLPSSCSYGERKCQFKATCKRKLRHYMTFVFAHGDLCCSFYCLL